MLDHDKAMLRLRTSLRLICCILQPGRKQQLAPITRLRGPEHCDVRLIVTPQHITDGCGRHPGNGNGNGRGCSNGSVCPAAPRRSSKGAAWLTSEVIGTQLPSLRLALLPGVLCIFPSIYPLIASSCPFIHPSSQISSFQPSTPPITTSLTSCFTHVRCHTPSFWITSSAPPPLSVSTCVCLKDPIVD